MTQKDYSLLFAKRLLNHSYESVKDHFEANPPAEGDVLILSMQQHNMNRYRLVKVLNPASGRQRRIIISHSDAFAGAAYYRSGQSCFAPKGQTRLLPLVPAVAELLSFDRDTIVDDATLESLLPTLVG